MYKSFLYFIISLISLFFLSILVWESYAHLKAPELSILNSIHQAGYLRSLPIKYEPDKGIWHILGWTGSASMTLMMAYSIRKRLAFMDSAGMLHNWLNLHILLGILGTVFITAHTTLKFGGLVSVSYWSMIITSLSGIVGRYIYIQIPRGISGSELKIEEIDRVIREINKGFSDYPKVLTLLKKMTKTEEISKFEDKDLSLIYSVIMMAKADINNILAVRKLKKYLLARDDISTGESQRLISLCKDRVRYYKRLNLLSTSHRLFRFWHIFHLPLAIIMFLIMFIHIGISYIFKVY